MLLRLLNGLKRRVEHTHHPLHFTQIVYLCTSYDSWSKQQYFPEQNKPTGFCIADELSPVRQNPKLYTY
jgi:hypothetical protein